MQSSSYHSDPVIYPEWVRTHSKRPPTSCSELPEWLGTYVLGRYRGKGVLATNPASALDQLSRYWTCNASSRRASLCKITVTMVRIEKFVWSAVLSAVYIFGLTPTICGRAICVGHATSTPSSSATFITHPGSRKNCRPTEIRSA